MPPPPRQPGPRPEMVQMSGSLDPATANASSADHVVQFFPRKPVLLGRRVLSFFARLGRLRFHRVARALFSAEVYPPSILSPYFALPCTILTCLCASVWFWQRYCRFGIGAAALQACFRARSCTPSADQCSASIALKLPPPSTSGVALGKILALHSPPGQGKPGYQASQPAYRVSSCSPAKPVATPCLLLLGNLAQGQRWCKCCPDRLAFAVATVPLAG